VEACPGGVLPLASLEAEVRNRFQDPDLNLRRGNWLTGLVRLPPMTASSSSLHVVSLGDHVERREYVQEEEYVASPAGTFLRAYFRRVVDKLFVMQKVQEEGIKVQHFGQVRVYLCLLGKQERIFLFCMPPHQ
jgi:hypothetical protein